MKIEKNKVVGVSYTLIVDGQVADKATEEKPLEYIHGTNMLIPRFEHEIEGKEPGEDFAFVVSPEEGYGTYDQKFCFDIPKSSFEIDGKVREDLLVVGNFIPMMNTSGHVVNGKIKEIKENEVTMDFNHPMAGKTLNFSGKVISVREATQKELTEGLHGEYLPEEECECCHGHHHDHKDGECCHGHHHDHKDGECCHGHNHKDGECCCKDGK